MLVRLTRHCHLSRDVNLEIGGAPTSEDSSPTWSPDGSRISFTRRASRTDPYHPVITNADAKNPKVLEDLAVDQRAMTWSPDGATIMAYVSHPPTGVDRVVTLIDVAGARPTKSITINFDQQAQWQWLPP
ncbi:MAG TPA: hypothetical protein VIR16_02320 [Candidatus Limnocylindrales bacterium]